MNHLKTFRVINEIEQKIILDSILKILPQILLILEERGFKFYISFNILNSKDKYPAIYLVPHNLIGSFRAFKPEPMISSAGLYFGFLKRSQFLLSLEGADFLCKLNIIPQKFKITVNDKGEKSILYGNEIEKNFVSNIPKTLRKNDFLFVFNRIDELISIGRSLVDYSKYRNLCPNDIFASNLVDKGYYLRKKQ